MTWLIAAINLVGFNLAFWSMVGAVRFLVERRTSRFSRDGILDLPALFRWFTRSLFASATGVAGLLIIALSTLAFLSSQFPPGSVSPDQLTGFFRQDQHYFFPVVAWFLSAIFAGSTIARLNRSDWISAVTIVAIAYWYASRWIGDQFLSISFPLESPISVGTLAASFGATWFGQWISFRRQASTIESQSVFALPRPYRIRVDQVAVVMPAHNEEAIIGEAISELKRVVPARNIFIGSDASTDRTVDIARSLGCTVADIHPNCGKAGALDFVIHHYQLPTQYAAVLILDADTRIDSHYLERALALFDNPEVVAVAGHAVSKWQPWHRPFWSRLIAGYRTRLYRVVQYGIRYGQTWTNITTCIPGFASMYRASVLSQIDINAPGLIIEDFNMTFEVLRKKLGRVAYSPGVIATTEDPHTLRDYTRQVRRWCLGFWQTVRRHGIWPSRFWLAHIILLAEVITFSVFIVLVPPVIVWFALTNFQPLMLPYLPTFSFVQVSISDVLIGVLVTDYALTILVALAARKPALFIYGLGFLLFRVIDAALFLATIPMTFTVKSEGRWVSPRRQVAT